MVSREQDILHASLPVGVDGDPWDGDQCWIWSGPSRGVATRFWRRRASAATSAGSGWPRAALPPARHAWICE
ncbi:hypothetical protein E2562_023025 [Oryza meyeriana var. granulata]|uniref:Uncharacterized protein n=1 Tax=Oryza meyeriana var. granulata TaxID=110450 RepID=A0A6G1EYM2_9ORYZ|nr:hypothetical protein E2562_023025 [Oryza meyeriana var. granulata]